jgi:hypothetical protein
MVNALKKRVAGMSAAKAKEDLQSLLPKVSESAIDDIVDSIIGEGLVCDTSPRYGDRRISDALYEELRPKTPSKKIQDMAKKATVIGAPDPILPGKIIEGTLNADHILPMDKITRMEGFDTLTMEQQKEVLNFEENFVFISEAANKSKGSKSYEEWTVYKKENIPVDPKFREEMITKSKELEKKLQKRIDDLNTENKLKELTLVYGKET